MKTKQTKTHADGTKIVLWRKLKAKELNVLVPPTWESMITKVTHAKQDNKGTITLHYTDGTTEQAACKDIELVKEESLVSIVSQVQKRARMAR